MDIAKVNYDYIEPYIVNIGELTVSLINSDKDRAANLAIEFWTSLCEVEIERNTNGNPHKNIVSRCSNSLLEIIFLGLQKLDET